MRTVTIVIHRIVGFYAANIPNALHPRKRKVLGIPNYIIRQILVIVVDARIDNRNRHIRRRNFYIPGFRSFDLFHSPKSLVADIGWNTVDGNYMVKLRYKPSIVSAHEILQICRRLERDLRNDYGNNSAAFFDIHKRLLDRSAFCRHFRTERLEIDALVKRQKYLVGGIFASFAKCHFALAVRSPMFLKMDCVAFLRANQPFAQFTDGLPLLLWRQNGTAVGYNFASSRF